MRTGECVECKYGNHRLIACSNQRALLLWLLTVSLISPTRKLQCCGAQLLRFRATAQFLPWRATFAQLWQISGCFCANNLPFWGNLGANWTSEHPLSFLFEICSCLKLATSCFHTSFHSRCQWARVARLMTLQRSLQYSLSLSWTKTFFPKISNFCTSLGLYNIDRCCFVVRCQNLAKCKGPK